MKAERQKMYRRVSGQMVMAHFNGKLVACVKYRNYALSQIVTLTNE